MSNQTMALTDLISAIAPIDGVSIGQWDDRATWRVDFKLDATDDQKATAKSILDSFTPSIP